MGKIDKEIQKKLRELREMRSTEGSDSSGPTHQMQRAEPKVVRLIGSNRSAVKVLIVYDLVCSLYHMRMNENAKIFSVVDAPHETLRRWVNQNIVHKHDHKAIKVRVKNPVHKIHECRGALANPNGMTIPRSRRRRGWLTSRHLRRVLLKAKLLELPLKPPLAKRKLLRLNSLILVMGRWGRVNFLLPELCRLLKTYQICPAFRKEMLVGG
ncbi:hypothetical protein U1Q18_009132 [Sarracenia purpurea var. burkii]